jgi:hypothetical protein
MEAFLVVAMALAILGVGVLAVLGAARLLASTSRDLEGRTR